MRNLPVEIMRIIRDTHIKGKTVVYRDAFILSFYLVGINMANIAGAAWGSTPYFIKDNFKGGLLSNGLKELKFAKNNISNLVYSKESITFAISNNKNPAATYNSGTILWQLLEK